MKKLFLLLFVFTAYYSHSFGSAKDTVDYWHVSRNGKVILKGSPANSDVRINITKGNLFETEFFEIQYFEDSPCAGCQPLIIAKVSSGEKVLQISPLTGTTFKIKTKQIQQIAHRSNYQILRFYYVESAGGTAVKLFEVEVK